MKPAREEMERRYEEDVAVVDRLRRFACWRRPCPTLANIQTVRSLLTAFLRDEKEKAK